MSSIIPGFEYDIFISYRQKDNKGDRWVSEFVEALKTELESTFKEEIIVYFDINPHDGLLETHDVDASLKDKLKCLVFIPIISRTYCDPKSFAWEHEFKAFIEQASQDQFGLKVKLPNGNVANRVLPIRIHDLDVVDIQACESVLGGVLRGIEFIYKSPGVNRPLRPREDNPSDNLNHKIYRDQINKVALAIREIIESIHYPVSSGELKDKESGIKADIGGRKTITKNSSGKDEITSKPKLLFEKWSIKTRSMVLALVAIVLIPVITVVILFYGQKQKRYARNVILPEIQKLVEEHFNPPPRAFQLTAEAQKVIPNDSSLINLWPKVSEYISLQTEPEGATVFWKDYNKPQDPWNENGVTPIKNMKFPSGHSIPIRIKIEKEGFQTVYLTNFRYINLKKTLKLDSLGTLPDNMVRIPTAVSGLPILFIENYAGKLVGEFLADRFEVTNKEYKRFVDSGGYSNKNYWKYPVYEEGKEIPLDKALELFTDRTGRPGPASWEAGTYLNGKDNHPVAGVSWYEAAAYAAFAGKRLPTVYHWNVMAQTHLSMYTVPLSNFNGNGTVPVGTMDGLSSYGIYDLAGNVREWCYNGDGINGEAYIMGGGWNDPEQSFIQARTQPSIDRSLSNGFRCIMELPGDPTISSLTGPLEKAFRDYRIEKPVDDQTYNIFLRQYDYDKTPLNARITATADTGLWKVEKVVMDAGYSDEKLIVYLFIPRKAQPPYQPVILFPGANAIIMDMITSNYIQRIDFIVKSGRLLVYPVLKGTYERKDELKSGSPDETVFYRDHVIMWRKDIGRTIDYLETRSDILSDRMGYFGWSWGGRLGGLIPAVEKRIKAIVIHVGGLDENKSLPEVDALNFVSRIKQPVLMLNGKYDPVFPVESSQIPMFNLFGTPPEDKNIKIYDTGHLVPKTEMIKETLAWYDKYLGPVKQ